VISGPDVIIRWLLRSIPPAPRRCVSPQLAVSLQLLRRDHCIVVPVIDDDGRQPRDGVRHGAHGRHRKTPTDDADATARDVYEEAL